MRLYRFSGVVCGHAMANPQRLQLKTSYAVPSTYPGTSPTRTAGTSHAGHSGNEGVMSRAWGGALRLRYLAQLYIYSSHKTGAPDNIAAAGPEVQRRLGNRGARMDDNGVDESSCNSPADGTQVDRRGIVRRGRARAVSMLRQRQPRLHRDELAVLLVGVPVGERAVGDAAWDSGA